MATKSTKKSTSKGSRNVAALYAWVKKYGRKPNTQRTSEVIAKVASKELGFVVSANRMARELYRQNIDFRRTKLDPEAPKFSKVELLRAQVQAQKSIIDGLVKRLGKIEGKVGIKSFEEGSEVVTPKGNRNKTVAVKKAAKAAKPVKGNGKDGKGAKDAKAKAPAPKVKAKTKPAVKKRPAAKKPAVVVPAEVPPTPVPVVHDLPQEPAVSVPQLTPLGETGEGTPQTAV